jgi:hypothetical protein
MFDLVGANNGSRRALDYYPTPDDVTKSLLNFLELPPDVVWEPAAGEGHMAKIIEMYGHTVIQTDISSGFDYLKTNAPDGIGAIITNPPFNLSEKFIEKAVKEAPLVAMLTKSQYWHARKRVDLFRRTRPKFVLPLTWRPNFLFHKKSAPTMEVYWTVWVRGFLGDCWYIPLDKPTVKEAA